MSAVLLHGDRLRGDGTVPNAVAPGAAADGAGSVHPRLSIVHLRSSTGLYGAEQVVLGLSREQARRGCDSRLIVFAPTDAPAPALLAAAGAQGVDATPLHCRGAVDPHSLLALRGLLFGGGVDVVHCHDYKSIVYARLASEGLGLTRVATLHGWLRGGLRLRVYRWLELRALRGFERVCAVSPRIADELATSGIGADRIRRVSNGIDTTRFRPDPGARGRAGRSSIHIGVAARLSPEKNLAQLVHAVAECRRRGKPLRLTIVGDGPLRADLQRLAERRGLSDSVRFEGALERLEHWYPRLDAFVLPSLTEGMPMTVLEALACGCPVVASAVGSLPEMLDGLPGSRLVEPGDAGALVDALMGLQPLAAPLEVAHERVRQRWSLAAMADDYEAVYREAMDA